jgi:hypothetical protein
MAGRDYDMPHSVIGNLGQGSMERSGSGKLFNGYSQSLRMQLRPQAGKERVK